MRSPRFLVSMTLLCCLAVGCESGGKKLETIPVAGRVTIDGKPLDGASVMFIPVDKTAGNGAFGVTDKDGAYTLSTASGQAGCPAGRYGVAFTKVTLPDGSPIPAGKGKMDQATVEHVPAAYTFVPSQDFVVKVNVEKGKEKHDFDLDSKKKPFIKRPGINY